jgi:hypothetical protein
MARHCRAPAWEAALHRKPCPHHPGRQLTYYCVTCDQPACSDCRISGPHRGAGHSTVSIQEAFFAALRAVSASVHGPLRARRDEILAHIAELDGAVARVSASREDIEQRALGEYEAIIARLRRTESLQLAVVQQDLASLRRDLSSIETLTNRINSISLDASSQANRNSATMFSSSGTQPEFGLGSLRASFGGSLGGSLPIASAYSVGALLSDPAALSDPGFGTAPAPPTDAFSLLRELPQIKRQVDRLAARGSSAADLPQRMAEVHALDGSFLPDEMSERAQLADKLRTATRLLAVKSQLLEVLESDRDSTLSDARAELTEWEGLSERYAVELERRTLACAMCGCVCDAQTANSMCEANVPATLGTTQSVTRAGPLVDAGMPVDEAVAWLGNSRHYFVSTAR